MSQSDEAVIEGISDLDDFIEEESHEDEPEKVKGQRKGGKSYRELVESQNDLLLDKNFKEYFKDFSKLGGFLKNTPDPTIGSFNLLTKDEEKKKPTIDKETAEIIKMDLPELQKLIDSLKNGVLVMRLRISELIEMIRNSEIDPTNSISLINLRIEILTDYISYLCVFALLKVIF